MSLHRTRYRIQLDSSATAAARDAFRQDMANGCDQNNVKGYFILDDNEMWIHLEGDEDDIETVARAVGNASNTTGQLTEESDQSITSVLAVGVYAYDEDRSPIVPN